MKKQLFLSTEKDLVREAITSAWVDSFLREHLKNERWSTERILPVAHEIIYQYLRVHSEVMMMFDLLETHEVEEYLREVAAKVVIVRPSHDQPGARKLCPSWDISEHGDTYDGEYEQVAPVFERPQ